MYAWHNSTKKLSQLDYFLVSAGTMNIIETTTIKPGYQSDHAIVELTLNMTMIAQLTGADRGRNRILK
jgi:hypothetical protein